MNFKKDKTKNAGYALLEIIFYATFFVIISFVVINSLLVMQKSFQITKIQQQLSSSSSILERISREIKQAIDINSITSNTLELKTKDDAGLSKTVKFMVSGTDMQLWENNILTGNLNTAEIEVSNLVFTQITTANGKAVKVSYTVSSAEDKTNRTENFQDTLVLRGAY